MKIFDPTLATLERSLDIRLARQNVLAGNVANIDTPGFVPKDLDFAEAMRLARGEAERAMLPAGPIALDSPREGFRAAAAPGTGGSPLVVAEGARPGLDGNAVDLDRTMVSMAQNALQYAASAKAAGKKLAILRYVVSDGAA